MNAIDHLIDAINDQSKAIVALQRSLSEWQKFLEETYGNPDA